MRIDRFLRRQHGLESLQCIAIVAAMITIVLGLHVSYERYLQPAVKKASDAQFGPIDVGARPGVSP